MSHKLRDLQTIPDAQLMEEHDALAQSTVASVDYYLDELRRRQMLRAMESSAKLARAALYLTIVNTVVALIAVVVAVA